MRQGKSEGTINKALPSMKSLLPVSSHPANPESTLLEKTERARSEAALDAILVQRFLAGEEAAFAEIVGRYRAKIFTAAFTLLHNHGDAEEITQDAFMRAYRGLAKFRGDSSLATWLYRITFNLARNRYWYFFRRQRHATISFDNPLRDEPDVTISDLVAADTPDPAQESARAEFSELASQCMGELEECHREILAMRNAHHPYSEIAAAFGLNVGTVKSRIARARKNLRARIAARCPEFADVTSPDDYFLPTRASSRLRLAAA